MNIIERGKAFVQSLYELANRSAWEWRRCPHCGQSLTCKWGTYIRRPWFFEGRQEVEVQRHRCGRCRRTYSESSALLVRGSWYAREVHRYAVDHWQHVGSSLRRTAEVVRSWLGRQERWQLWRPLEQAPPIEARCHLSASTVHRWLDGLGRRAAQTVPGQLAGVTSSGQVGTDGLWACLRGRTKGVVLAVVDSVSGLIWPPIVVAGEEAETGWKALFQRAQQAGLNLAELGGIVSDGAIGLIGYIERGLYWVNHQRCVFHLWRNLAGTINRAASEAAKDLAGELAKATREQVRRELVALMRGVLDARSEAEAELALGCLAAHQFGARLVEAMAEHLDAALVYLSEYNQGLMRVAPEWCWRDFRLRLSRGRNHGSTERLERAALVWAIYHNFEPAQWRSERKRHYRRPGQSSLTVSGVPPGTISYLDALSV